MMMTDYGGRTATIYQFPVGGRAAIRREQEKNSLEAAALRAPQVDFGSWYHQEAVAQAVEEAGAPKQGNKS